VVALLAVTALTTLLLVPTSGTAARAAVPGPGQTRTGRATHYSLGVGAGGNCSFPAEKLSDHLYVAAGPEDYADAGGCGAYLDVTGPSGKVRVIIADKCHECESGHLDLSEESFSKIGKYEAGIIPISYQTVRDPALPGPLEVRVKEGSSQWWTAFLIMNHGNPLTSVEYRDSSGAWRALARQPYNYWLKSDGAGPGPFTLRITDAVGHQATVGNIALSPMATQRTNIWMYGSSAGTPPTTVTPTPTVTPT
jgi:expansin (peptidoglycan-binding protein)